MQEQAAEGSARAAGASLASWQNRRMLEHAKHAEHAGCVARTWPAQAPVASVCLRKCEPQA